MSCGGGMMRTSLRPLAHLVDRAAERWLAAARAPAEERRRIRREIAGSFDIGDNERLTFHGQRFVLTVNSTEDPTESGRIEVHEIGQND